MTLDPADPHSNDEPHDITALLIAWSEGDRQALDALMPAIYAELRRLAGGYLRNESRNPMQTTELVHEAYLRLAGSDVDWRCRSHFFVIAARTMRRLLVDLARQRAALRRGGDARPVTLREADARSPAVVDVLGLDEALRELSTFDARKAKVIELRFFGGLTVIETASALAVSTATIERDLRAAKAWLATTLGDATSANHTGSD